MMIKPPGGAQLGTRQGSSMKPWKHEKSVKTSMFRILYTSVPYPVFSFSKTLEVNGHHGSILSKFRNKPRYCWQLTTFLFGTETLTANYVN